MNEKIERVNMMWHWKQIFNSLKKGQFTKKKEHSVIFSLLNADGKSFLELHSKTVFSYTAEGADDLF